MKKIKKLKIIEEGRIQSPEELKEIKGGCSTYTGCNKYSNCGWFSHESCQPAAYGYQSCSSGYTTTCSSGYSYSSCGISTYTSCGPNTSYSG